MSDDSTIYHGTDDVSAAQITSRGLDQKAWIQAAGGAGVDPKGFSVTTDKATAEAWALVRAVERGGRPVVLSAPTDPLPLRQGSLTDLVDPNEFFISPRDFNKVGPHVFRYQP